MDIVKVEFLCFDSYTNRYFRVDPCRLETVSKSLNAILAKNEKASLNDYYELLGLPKVDGFGDDMLIGDLDSKQHGCKLKTKFVEGKGIEVSIDAGLTPDSGSSPFN